jgi:hypothetical protein
MNNDLMQKLVVAKKIMDRHNSTPRGNASPSISAPQLESFNAPPAMYNIPQEFVSEQKQQVQQQPQAPVKDRILNSKLPDEIKKLMIEHPIEQPNTMGGPSLSNDLIEAAARLMKTDAAGNTTFQEQKQPNQQPQSIGSGLDYNVLRRMMKDVVEEVLTEKGLVTESTQKTKETMQFKVGQHLFEGVITKIKKLK